MPSSSRRPAIAGAAQILQRVQDPADTLELVGLMEQAVRKAAEDAGAPKLVESLDAIYVPRGLWRYDNPARMLASPMRSRSICMRPPR